MSEWFVYLIRSANNALYTGITTDVVRRVEEHKHNTKKAAKALRGKGPLNLVFSRQLADKSLALKVEWAIKKLTKTDKEKLLTGELCFEHLRRELE